MKKTLSIAMLCMMLFANVASAVDLCCVDTEHALSHAQEISYESENHDDNSNNDIACDCCACHGHYEIKLFSAFDLINIQLTDTRTKSALSGRLFISEITNSLYRPPIA